MRFRASINNVPTFFRIVQAIEKLQKKCIVKFTQREMHLICNSDANEGGIQVWSQIKIDSIFANYRIQSNADNEITLALSTDALLAALRSASASSSSSSSAGASNEDEIVVKLAKKNDHAVLSFEITGMMTRVGMNVRVAHEVKIDILRASDVARLREPMCPEPDVHIVLPPLQKLRTVVDRLRLMSDTMAIRANNSGKLRVSIRTDTVKLDTQWTNCMNPKMTKPPGWSQEEDPDETDEPDPERFFTLLISTRSFLKFLSGHVVSTTTIACICQHHCMILYVYIGDAEDAGGVLTFYIPAILDDGDH